MSDNMQANNALGIRGCEALSRGKWKEGTFINIGTYRSIKSTIRQKREATTT